MSRNLFIVVFFIASFSGVLSAQQGAKVQGHVLKIVDGTITANFSAAPDCSNPYIFSSGSTYVELSDNVCQTISEAVRLHGGSRNFNVGLEVIDSKAFRIVPGSILFRSYMAD